MPKSIRLDGLTYIVRGFHTLPPSRYVRDPLTFTEAVITSEPLVPFPNPIPPSGDPSAATYLPHRYYEQKPPWGMGIRTDFTEGRIYYEEDVNALFPGIITLGPVRAPGTFTGKPATFKAALGGNTEGLNTVWLFGNGAAANDEPCWYWVGSTATWTNGTLNNDTTLKTLNDVTGMCLVGNTTFAVAKVKIVEGGFNTYTWQTTTNTAWAPVNSTGSEGLGLAGATELWGLVAYFRASTNTWRLCSIARVTATGEIQLVDRATTGTAASYAGMVTGTIQDTTATPRGLCVWRDAVGTQDVFVGTNRHIYWHDISAGTINVIHDFKRTDSAYTGQLAVLSDGSLGYTDGGNIGHLWWDANQGVKHEDVGPFAPDNIPWEGLPLAMGGNVTWIAASKDQPWVYAGVGGLTAAQTGWIGVYNLRTRHWNNPSKTRAAAQLATFAGFETAQNDGVTRLHFTEESAAGGNQNPNTLNYITSNPTIETANRFVAGGVIRTSRFWGWVAVLRKGFFKFRVFGDAFTANENLSVKFATNNGSLGSAQTITSIPGSIWIDGSATAVGADAFDLSTELTLSRDAADGTKSPKLRAFAYSYLSKALKDDDTPIRRFSFSLDLVMTGKIFRGLKGIETVKANLLTTLAKRVLVPFSYSPATVATPIKVMIITWTMTEEPSEEDPQNYQGPLRAIVDLVVQEVI